MTEPFLEEGEWLPWLRLGLAAGVGRARGNELLARYGNPEGVLAQTKAELLHGAKLPETVVDDLLRPSNLDEARQELARLRALRVRLAHLRSPDYPDLLKEIPHPPIVLGRLGPLANPGERAVAIVGSREAGARAQRLAFEFARAFAQAGITVVSGLAKGVDRAAHEGALAVPDGRTVAVQGCGLARVYPAEHARLAARIRERGALWSEYAVDARPLWYHFPTRNRIIAGASLGVVVMAAREHSGALITAGHANGFGRGVFTIPGTLDDRFARGSNQLIKDGAALVEGPSEVLEALELLAPRPNVDPRPPLFVLEPPRKGPPPTGVPGEIVRYLEGMGRICTFDEIVFENRIDARAAMAALGYLAVRRLVREVPGAGYQAAAL